MEHYFVIICLINGVFNDKLKGEPFEETLLQLEQFNMNMKQKYRSIGIMDDFSNIVTNMISSLQEVQVRHNLEAIFGLLLTFLFQSKGEDMVTKIKTQEAKLSKVIKDIETKEEYVKQVQFEMKQIDEINKRIKSELGNI